MAIPMFSGSQGIASSRFSASRWKRKLLAEAIGSPPVAFNGFRKIQDIPSLRNRTLNVEFNLSLNLTQRLT